MAIRVNPPYARCRSDVSREIDDIDASSRLTSLPHHSASRHPGESRDRGCGTASTGRSRSAGLEPPYALTALRRSGPPAFRALRLDGSVAIPVIPPYARCRSDVSREIDDMDASSRLTSLPHHSASRHPGESRDPGCGTAETGRSRSAGLEPPYGLLALWRSGQPALRALRLDGSMAIRVNPPYARCRSDVSREIDDIDASSRLTSLPHHSASRHPGESRDPGCGTASTGRSRSAGLEPPYALMALPIRTTRLRVSLRAIRVNPPYAR